MSHSKYEVILKPCSYGGMLHVNIGASYLGKQNNDWPANVGYPFYILTYCQRSHKMVCKASTDCDGFL